MSISSSVLKADPVASSSMSRRDTFYLYTYIMRILRVIKKKKKHIKNCLRQCLPVVVFYHDHLLPHFPMGMQMQ